MYCLWQRIQHVPIFLTALANVLENTALFGDILLRLPDITHEVKQKVRLYIFKVLKALYISLNFRLSKRCVPSNLILLKRKSSISAIDISSRMSVKQYIIYSHSTDFSFSNWHYFYIPCLPINSSKRKSLFESQSLSLVILRTWFILGTRVRLFSTKNCQGISWCVDWLKSYLEISHWRRYGKNQ